MPLSGILVHALWPALDELAFVISEVAKADDDEVDKCPYSATSTGNQLNDSRAGLSYIESVNAEASYKETKKEGYQPVFATSVIRYGLLNRSDCTATFYADNGIVVYFCSTITAIHSRYVLY
jgi:hypothetical protein